MRSQRNKLIVIVGETASGKSSLAIHVAKKYDGEVIAADSRTIYKGMDIGSAKPTRAEMDRIPHYGLDLVEPNQSFSAAQFKEYADAKIKDIWKRKKVPILVGGTGLYVDGVLFNYSFGGNYNTVERSQLNNKTVEELATLAEELDIEISEQTKTNPRHLARLIERGGVTERNTELVYDALIIGVRVSRTELRKRIERRVELMFRKGLRKEYNDLRAKYPQNSEAFTGIGYKEFASWEIGNTSMSEVKRQIVKNTMRLARMQRTWFKRNPKIQWVDSPESALELIAAYMGE